MLESAFPEAAIICAIVPYDETEYPMLFGNCGPVERDEMLALLIDMNEKTKHDENLVVKFRSYDDGAPKGSA